jgi:hypothetical protein
MFINPQLTRKHLANGPGKNHRGQRAVVGATAQREIGVKNGGDQKRPNGGSEQCISNYDQHEISP